MNIIRKEKKTHIETGIIRSKKLRRKDLVYISPSILYISQPTSLIINEDNSNKSTSDPRRLDKQISGSFESTLQFKYLHVIGKYCSRPN
jgi:hypothetical protein